MKKEIVRNQRAPRTIPLGSCFPLSQVSCPRAVFVLSLAEETGKPEFLGFRCAVLGWV
jgi:hypothetical protein